MNIFVGNLPYEADERDLLATFEPFGVVASVNIVRDRTTGRSRGFGFVNMIDRDEGALAITSTDGKELRGRTLKVAEARPRPPRQGGAGW